jgi:AcrR family transcriptional regulator
MDVSPTHRQPRRRADARRNRERLVAAATQAFASGEHPVSMDSVAKRAGVGSGTLYRHFPTRGDLVQEVYRDQMQRLRVGAHELLKAEPPARALHMWMGLFADWAATKFGMRETLGTIMAVGRIVPSQMRDELVKILRTFLDAGAREGDLRDDVQPTDLGAILAGVLIVAGAPEERAQLDRMLELIVTGLLPR